MKDEAVTPILGTLLMLALMMTLVPGAIMLKNEWSKVQNAQYEAMQTEREAWEKEAFCNRNPSMGSPDCPQNDFLSRWNCQEMANLLVCHKRE